MSDQDSIFDYPDINLKPSQQQTEQRVRQIINKKSQPTPEYLTHFYDKNTFDYQTMFVNVTQPNNETLLNEYIPNTISMVSMNKQNQILQQGEEQEQQSPQSSEDDWQQSILKGIALKQQEGEQKQQKSQKLQKQPPKSQSSKKQLSNRTPSFQKEEEKEEEDKEEESSIKQVQPIDNSQIDNFSQQFLYAESIRQASKQNNSQNDQDSSQVKQIKEIGPIVTSNILQISQIKQHRQDAILDALNQQGQQGITEAERQKIEQQLQALPLKVMKYRIKAENCQKINMKFVTDPFHCRVKVKDLQPNHYMKIENKKLTVSGYMHDDLIWKVGSCKTKIIPAVLLINCYSCKQVNICKIDPISHFCSTICKNQNCTKNIIIEIIQVILQ